MVEESELNSFIEKFKNLWRSGLSAHLNLETNGGQAWVGLHLHLGVAPGPHPNPNGFDQKTKNSACKERRRKRREALRKTTNSQNASNYEVNFKVNDNEESAEKVEQESEIENLDITKKVELEKVVANHDTAEEVDNGDKI